jgi:hypothetical protein
VPRLPFALLALSLAARIGASEGRKDGQAAGY